MFLNLLVKYTENKIRIDYPIAFAAQLVMNAISFGTQMVLIFKVIKSSKTYKAIYRVDAILISLRNKKITR